MSTSTVSRRRRSLAALVGSTVVLAAIAVGSVSPAAGAEPTRVEMTPELKTQIQQAIETYLGDNGIPGIAVAVVTPDAAGTAPITTTFVAGKADLATTRPVDESTRFELGSESKVFTADLLAALVAAGRVSLDDPVSMYAPTGYTVPTWTDGTVITLGNLATHQSGLPYIPPNYQDACPSNDPGCNWHPGYTQTMLWTAVQGQTLLSKPGTDWLYSNFGFGLLGTILANVVQQVPIAAKPALQSAYHGAFLGPLGLTATVIEPYAMPPAAPPVPELAVPYDAGSPTNYWLNDNAIAGGGGLISTAPEMGAWVAAHLGYVAAGAPQGVVSMAQTLQPVSTVSRICTDPPYTCENVDFRMGLGWQLYENIGTHRVLNAQKDGGTAGFATGTVLFPTLRTGVTTMANQSSANDQQLSIQLAELILTEASRKPALAATGSDAAPAAVGALAVLLVGVAMLTARRRRRV